MRFNLELFGPNGECIAVHQYDADQVQAFTGMAMFDILDLKRATVVFRDGCSYHLFRMEDQ